MSDSKSNIATRFQPGNTLGGRPKGARARLGEKFQQSLADDFEQFGAAVISDVRQNDPSTYLSIVAKLQPREVEAKLQIEQKIPGNLTADEYAQLRGVLELLEHLAPSGVAAGEILATVERALVAAYIDKPALAIEAPRTAASPARPIQLDLVDAVAAAVPKPPY